MGVDNGGPVSSDPDKVMVGMNNEPTECARVIVEKIDWFKAEIVVPPDHAGGLLASVIYSLCAIGAVLGPMLTLRAAPASPTWILVAAAFGQLIVLVTVASTVHRDRKSVV